MHICYFDMNFKYQGLFQDVSNVKRDVIQFIFVSSIYFFLDFKQESKQLLPMILPYKGRPAIRHRF